MVYSQTLREYTENASFRPFVDSPRLLFLTFNKLVANPKKLLYTVANPAIINSGLGIRSFIVIH